jgi:UDP-N-acetylglucosamine--N-acetylmuramyl-(pentapeptide) pyrophosphoryl-undecaprenol N-acetylglucosamine transferase
MISGGGTGGHVFPAIAIANALRERFPQIEILFVGAKGKLEMTKVPEAGYPIEGLWISGIQRKISADNLLFPVKLLSSMWKASGLIRKFKPQVVVGVGGYASGPILRVASGKKIPCLIQEQNSFAGLTNKWLAKGAERICVAYEGMDRYFPADRIVLTGNPVRKEIVQQRPSREEATAFFDLDAYKPTILVLGGSLGARSINEAVKAQLDILIKGQVQIIWQTGKLYEAEMLQYVQSLGGPFPHIKAMAFIRDMPKAYAAADVVISRAGALSISELCIVGKPVIFVPSPNVAEDHQTKNAQALVKQEAARLVKDAESKEKMIPAALDLLIHKAERDKLSQNISRLATPDAADRIADQIIAIAK